MKRLLISVLLAVALLVIPVSGALAATTQGVEVTATPIYVSISNTPATEGLGTVAESSTIWAYAAIPADPLADATATFTVTNDGSVAAAIGIKATNFTGGIGWTLAGTVGVDTVVMKAGFEGETHAEMQIVTTTDAPFIASVAALGDIDWEFSVDTGTFTDGAEKTSTITLTATAA